MLLAREEAWCGRREVLFGPACMVLVLLVFAGGCVLGDNARSLPTLKRIRSKPLATDLPDLTAMGPGSRPIASISKIALPLRTSLNDVWSQVDEQVVPALARGVWQANGLRIGVLNRSDVGSFFEALPAVYGQNVSRVAVTEHLMPICASPRLGKAVTVDLTIPPWSVRELQVRRGKLQLLLGVASDLKKAAPPPEEDAKARQRLQWELVPHHNLPRFSLLPRSVLEKQLDGQVFDDLAMRLQLSEDQIIVLGLYWPWPNVLPESEDAAIDNAAASELGDPAPTANADDSTAVEPIADPADMPQAPVAPPLGNHIGRSLFTSLRMGQPVQTLMLLWIEPSPQNDMP